MTDTIDARAVVQRLEQVRTTDLEVNVEASALAARIRSAMEAPGSDVADLVASGVVLLGLAELDRTAAQLTARADASTAVNRSTHGLIGPPQGPSRG